MLPAVLLQGCAFPATAAQGGVAAPPAPLRRLRPDPPRPAPPAPPPSAPPRSCAYGGEATLVLTGGATNDPYAVCFPQFKVKVEYSAATRKCMLRITPDAMANNLKYGEATAVNGAKVRGGRQRQAGTRARTHARMLAVGVHWARPAASPALRLHPAAPAPPPLTCPPPHPCPRATQDCPKSTDLTLVAPVEGSTAADLNFALVRAMRAASFSASFVEGATFTTVNRATITTTAAGPDLTYAVSTGTLGSGAIQIKPAASAADACGASADCVSGGGVPKRYSVTVGTATIKALCPAGHSCDGNAKTACAAGKQATFVGSATCADCEVDTYADDAGNSHCTPCPAYSHAHFAGSTGCLACFFGKPKLIAGTFADAAGETALYPSAMPSEQPTTGEPAGGAAGAKSWRKGGGLL